MRKQVSKIYNSFRLRYVRAWSAFATHAYTAAALHLHEKKSFNRSEAAI